MQADSGHRQLHVQSDGVDPQHRPTSETTGTPFDQEAAPSRRENQRTPRPVAPSARVIDPAIGGIRSKHRTRSPSAFRRT
jgi:hypothetical protein